MITHTCSKHGVVESGEMIHNGRQYTCHCGRTLTAKPSIDWRERAENAERELAYTKTENVELRRQISMMRGA